MDSLTKWRRYLWWNWTFCDFLKRGKPPRVKMWYFAEKDTQDTVGWDAWREIDGKWIHINH